MNQKQLQALVAGRHPEFVTSCIQCLQNEKHLCTFFVDGHSMQ